MNLWYYFGSPMSLKKISQFLTIFKFDTGLKNFIKSFLETILLHNSTKCSYFVYFGDVFALIDK